MEIVIPDKKPRIRQKVQALDQRSFTVVPIRAASDRSLTPMELRVLMVYCSYTNKGGVAWVSAKTVGETLDISLSRAARLLKSLTTKGYLRTLHKGFRGIVAHTRQVIYKENITADEAATIAGELAPYQLEQQTKEQQAMIEAKEKKAKVEAKRQQRKDKLKAKLIEKNNSKVDANSVQLSMDEGFDSELVDLQSNKQYAHIDADILELAVTLAIKQAGDGATHADIDAAIDKLLR